MASNQARLWQVSVNDLDATYVCSESQSLLTALMATGCSPVKVGCRNGGCGVCRIRVKSGRYIKEKMTRSRISEADEREDIVLACRVFPRSDICLLPLPLTIRSAVA